MKYSYFLMLIFLGTIQCGIHKNTASVPAWLDNNKRASLFSTENYLQGFALSHHNSNEKIEPFLNRLITIARKELLESIRLQITNTTTSEIKEKNNELSSNYAIQTKTHSDFDITNIIVEKYYNASSHQGAVFAYARKTDVINSYAAKVNTLLDKAQNYLTNGKTLFEKGNIQKALQNYAKALPLLDETKNLTPILIALGNRLTPSNVNTTTTDIYNEINACINRQNLQLSIIGNDSFKGKFREQIAQSLQVQVKTQNDKNTNFIPQIPITFIQDTNILCTEYTNENGIATCRISHIKNPKNPQYIQVQLSLPDYLKISKNIADLPIFKNIASVVQYTLYIEPIRVYIKSEAYNTHQNQVHSLVSKIKFLLSEKNFVFTDNPDEAAFRITIKSEATFPENKPPIFFAYLNSSLSIYKINSQEEIYKNSYQLKGAGIDNNQATERASIHTFEKMKVDLLSFLD